MDRSYWFHTITMMVSTQLEAEQLGQLRLNAAQQASFYTSNGQLQVHSVPGMFFFSAVSEPIAELCAITSSFAFQIVVLYFVALLLRIC